MIPELNVRDWSLASFYPDKQVLSLSVGMSQRCRARTSHLCHAFHARRYHAASQGDLDLSDDFSPSLRQGRSTSRSSRLLMNSSYLTNIDGLTWKLKLQVQPATACVTVLLLLIGRTSTALTQRWKSYRPRKIYKPVRADTICPSRRREGY